MKNSPSLFRFFPLLSATALLGLLVPYSSAESDNAGEPIVQTDMTKVGSQITVTGEILDIACYMDHGAHGPKHADCARTCISSGLPVGIKTADGTVYLLIGEHKPANEQLAQYAAKTITVKGKFVARDGIKMIENIEIVP